MPGEEDESPRPELTQYGITGEARFATTMASFTRKGSGEIAIAYRIDSISWKDYDRVRSYPTVEDALNAIRLPLVRANFHFECTDQTLANLAMQELGPHIHNLIDGLAKGGLEFGNSTAEIVWKAKPLVEVSSTQSDTGTPEARFPFVWTIKKFAWFSPDDTVLLVRPRTGEFAGIRQYVSAGGTKKRDVPAHKLVHFIHNREFDGLYGVPRTKGAIPFVEQAVKLYDDASLYYSRFGCPTLIGYAPPHTREAGRDSNGRSILKTGVSIMRDTLKNIRNAYAVVFPSERDDSGNPKWRIEPLELGERASFTDMTTHLNAMIGASLCVPQLAMSTTPNSGTYNLGQAQIDLFTQNEEALLDKLRDVLNADLCAKFALYNAGHRAPPLTIVFEPLDANILQALLQGLIQNLVAGAPLYSKDGQYVVVDWAKLAKDKGVPIMLTDQPPMGAMPPEGGDPSLGGDPPPGGGGDGSNPNNDLLQGIASALGGQAGDSGQGAPQDQVSQMLGQ